MSKPGDLVAGCLTLGDAPDLKAAIEFLREWQPTDDPIAQELRRFHLSVYEAYFEEALLSPAGRRLYPEVAAQMDAHSHKPVRQ